MSATNINSIPDEILERILSKILTVPDDDFTKADGRSPFGRSLTSTSDMLLVNKRWLRVSTPLLYECVILRNTLQAQEFYYTLRGKSGPLVKRFIRRIRLEASFGSVTHKIFTLLPEIADIFLKYPSSADEKVDGVIKSLSKLNPKRVILGLPTNWNTWKNSQLMAKPLHEALRNWKALTCLKLQVSELPSHSDSSYESEQLFSIGESISVAPNLRLVIVSFSKQGSYGRLGSVSLVDNFVNTIGRNASLQSINLILPSLKTLEHTLEKLSDEPCRRIVQCALSSPAPPGMTACDRDDIVQIPHLPDEIIKNILDYYIGSYLSCDSSSASFSFGEHHRERCIELMVVSKRFYKISRSMPFRYIDADNLFHVSSRLAKTAHHSSVEIVILPNFEISPEKFIGMDIEATKMLSGLPRVSEISLPYQSVAVLERIPENVKLGVRLLELRYTGGGLFRRNVLPLFSNLASLNLSWQAFDKGNITALARIGNVDRICLPNVKSVRISDPRGHSILRVIEAFGFPSAHFLKLELSERLHLEPIDSEPISLPSFAELKIIDLYGLANGIYAQLMQVKRDKVEKIVVSSDRYMRREKLHVESPFIVETFETIEFGKFSALKELQLGSVDEWPFKDGELNSVWQNRAQRLINTYGFTIIDASGLPWKPRMQRRRNAKK